MDIKTTHFSLVAPHLALNSREPTGDWGLGGYIEDRLGGYSGGEARVGGGIGVVGSTLTFEVSRSWL